MFMRWRSFGCGAAGLLVVAAALFVTLRPVRATLITSGDVLVYRVGDGTTALTTAAAPISIREFTPAGVLVQSFDLPTTGTTAVTENGSSTANGILEFSADNAFLLFEGYH